MISRRVLTLFVAIAMAAVVTSGSAAAQPAVHRLAASGPGVGAVTVRPAMARPGQIVTLSGVTRAFVQHLPPPVLMQSARTHLVHFPPGPCQGNQTMPFVTTMVSQYHTGPGTRENPPAGTAWRVQFKVPLRMNTIAAGFKSQLVATPPGRYYLAVMAGGMDGPCGLISTSNAMIAVVTLTVQR